MPNLSTLLH